MKLLICGDLSVTGDSIHHFEKADAEGAFHSLCGLFQAADRTVVNLECALTDSDKRITKIGPCLKGPKSTAKTLKAAGVTDCTLSNNHIFDFGKKGLYDTLAELEKEGIGHVGIGENYEDSRRDMIIEHDGMKIAIVNVCEHEYSYATDDRVGARPFDEFETMYDIRQTKKENDYVIVVYHGGKEYCRYPSPRLLKACREMVRNGADAVLCQHSHIIGTYECFEGGHILYGQGNFHFVKPQSGETFNEGLMVELDITKKGIAFKLIPVVATEDGGIDRMPAEQAEKTLAEMNNRNSEIATGQWKERFHEFCLTKERWYRGIPTGESIEAPGDANQMLCHYLDCEAHRDVLFDLFKTWNHTNEME